MTQVITPVNHIRRHDIDWLRTLAFGLLILYHVGMYYVADWGWHVKSNNQSILLQDFMILTNQWRMSLLFFISGIALSLVVLQSRLSRKHLARLRLNRLIVPLIFSMCFIVPPQLFYELQQQHGQTMNYWAFLQEYWNVNTTLAPFKQSAIGLLTWNHLWFLPYLFIYSLLVLILFPLYSFVGKGLQTRGLSLWWFMGLIILSMAFIWAHLRESFPITNALVDDWYNHAKYFFVFSVGVLFPFLTNIWQQLIARRRSLLFLAAIGYVWLLFDRHGFLNIGDELNSLFVIKLTHGILLNANHWAWIFALVGYAGRYLNFSNDFLKYANKAILPWYILHQTLIIIIAMQLQTLHIHPVIEALLLITLTTIGCLIFYEALRQFSLLRWLFGLKTSFPLNFNKKELAMSKN